MFSQMRTQTSQAEEPRRVGGEVPEWLLDGILYVPPSRPLGLAVESLHGLKGIREAYQMATDTWVGAD